MKLAILGTGMIVQELLPVLHNMGIKPCAILGTDRHRERTLELVDQFEIRHCFFSYEELLDSTVDTVYIALPNSLHYSYGKKALLSDKNVIIEKPITTNYEELKELHALALEKHKILLEAMTLHYLPAFLHMKQDLKSLGDIRIVNLNFSQYSSRYDAFLQGTIAPAFDAKQAGGALMDLNVYNVHCAAGLFGMPDSVSYCANIQRKVDTSGILTLSYGNMKAVCIGAKDCQGPNLSSIQGEKGRIEFTQPTNQVNCYELAVRTGGREVKNFDEGNHRLSYEFREFTDIIDNAGFNRAESMLSISETAMKIMDAARKQFKL